MGESTKDGISVIFGEKIRALRIERGFSQSKVANEIGVTSNTVMAYEKGAQTPSLEVAAKLAEFFGESLDYLCGVEKVWTTYWDLLEKANLPSEIIISEVEFPYHLFKIDFSPIKGFWEKAKRIEALYDAGDIDKETLDFWLARQMQALEIPLTVEQ